MVKSRRRLQNAFRNHGSKMLTGGVVRLQACSLCGRTQHLKLNWILLCNLQNIWRNRIFLKKIVHIRGSNLEERYLSMLLITFSIQTPPFSTDEGPNHKLHCHLRTVCFLFCCYLNISGTLNCTFAQLHFIFYSTRRVHTESATVYSMFIFILIVLIIFSFKLLFYSWNISLLLSLFFLRCYFSPLLCCVTCEFLLRGIDNEHLM